MLKPWMNPLRTAEENLEIADGEIERLQHNLQVTEQTKDSYAELAAQRLEEIERLRKERDELLAALVNSRDALQLANEEMVDGPIVDTIWYGPAETLFDYMDAAIAKAKGAE